jgi:hypothetical protein
VTLTEQDLETIPPEIKDDIFRDDIAYLRGLADEAHANNPAEGYSHFMPFSIGPQNSRSIILRPCMGGECPLENWFADALRWKTDADFASINSSGI